MAIVGKVIQRAEVRPVEDEQYMSMKRKHIELSQEPNRKTRLISRQTKLFKPKANHAENVEYIKRKKMAGKRIRSSEDSVLDMMFDAFEKHQYISMASLESITHQPKAFLKELVNKHCIYNSRTRTYELKPESTYYGPTTKDDENGDGDDDDDDDDDES